MLPLATELPQAGALTRQSGTAELRTDHHAGLQTIRVHPAFANGRPFFVHPFVPDSVQFSTSSIEVIA